MFHYNATQCICHLSILIFFEAPTRIQCHCQATRFSIALSTEIGIQVRVA